MSQDQALLILNHPKHGMFARAGLTTDEATISAAWFVHNHYPEDLDDNIVILKSNLAKWLFNNNDHRHTITRPWPWPLAVVYNRSEMAKRMQGLPNWLVFFTPQPEFYDVLGFGSKNEVVGFVTETTAQFRGVIKSTIHGSLIFKLSSKTQKSYNIGYAMKLANDEN